jgi:hypothetical protein
MKAPRELFTRVSSQLHSGLAKVGFGREGPSEYTVRIADLDDIVGWLGTGHSVSRGDGALRIEPNAGVAYRSLQQLVASLNGGEWPAVLSTNIGYLMPQQTFKEYEFWVARDDTPMIDELIGDVVAYGLPYMRSMVRPEAIIKYLLQWEKPTLQAAHLLPAAYLLAGDRCAALETLDRFLADSRLREAVIVPDYVQYAERLRHLIMSR